MAESGDRIAEEGDGVDRISNLPRNIIDCILEHVPTRDVVRTSILSTKWRHIWTDHPKLVINKQFCKKVKQNSPQFACYGLADIIHKMLLQHSGPLLIFVIDTSRVSLADIGLWLLFLSRKGVRELTLDNSSYDDSSPAGCYELPSHIFSCRELTHLSISNCILKVPRTFEGFCKLNNLILDNVVLGSFLLRTPLLVHLELRCCSGVRDFNVFAPILEGLHLEENGDLQLRNYMICQDITKVFVDHYEVKHQGKGERTINLLELLGCWPRLSELSLDGLSLKSLCAGTVPERLPIKLNHFRCLTLYHVRFNMNQIAWVLCVLQSSPVLQKFEIWGYSFPSNDVKVFNYLDEPGCMNQNMEQLRIVRLWDFKGSRAEMQFVKLLLGRSPSLERMLVQEERKLDLSERLRITKELLQYPRASTKAEVICYDL